MKIKPFSDIIIFVRNPFFEKSPAETCFVENIRKISKFKIDSAIVNNSEQIPIKIINSNNFEIEIRKNTYLAMIEPYRMDHKSEQISTLIEANNNADLKSELKNIDEFHQSRLKNKFFDEKTLPDISLGNITPDQKSKVEKVLISENKAFLSSFLAYF